MATQTDQHDTGVAAPRRDKIALEIVTPKGTALKLDVDEVTAPSVEGEFGVLPGHLPLLAALKTGLVTYRQGSESKKCAVGRGFAEAGPDKVVILTDRYVEREQIDPVLVRKELAEIQQKMTQLEANAVEPTGENTELDGLIREENWLAAELELYGDPPPATMRPFETFGPTPGPDEDDVPAETGDSSANPTQTSSPN
jgi:F-type H+-transporting ATPase subunit epsilon